MPEALKRENMSLEELNRLRRTRSEDMTPGQIAKMKRIRDSVPAIDSDTVIRKTIPIGDVDKYIGEDGFCEIGGYMAREKDVGHIYKYRNVRESMRLDYTMQDGTTPYPKNGDSYGYIRFRTEDAERILIPYGKEFGGSSNEPAPATLNGFLSGRNGEIIPEWNIKGMKRLKPLKGAELHEVKMGKI